ncbi:hypothetical protein pb186bvf_015435 [Paramecium bursaria]
MKHTQVIFDLKDKPIRLDLRDYKQRVHSQPPPQKFICPNNNMKFNKRIINDYIQIVNKRQDQTSDLAIRLQQIQTKTKEYLETFYSKESSQKKRISSMLDIMSPEYRYSINSLMNSNKNKINSILHKQSSQDLSVSKRPSPTRTREKDKLFYLSEGSPKVQSPVVNLEDISDDDHAKRYAAEVQQIQQRDQEKQDRIKAKIFENQYKWQGNSVVKQQIFHKDMLSYSPIKIKKKSKKFNESFSSQIQKGLNQQLATSPTSPLGKLLTSGKIKVKVSTNSQQNSQNNSQEIEQIHSFQEDKSSKPDYINDVDKKVNFSNLIIRKAVSNELPQGPFIKLAKYRDIMQKFRTQNETEEQ